SSVEQIADAKAEILEDADTADVLVANAGDARVMRRASRFVGRTITFGVNVDADVEVRDVEARGAKGMRARLVTQGGSRAFDTALLGDGNLANIAAAAAVALDAGVPLDDIVSTVA